MRGKKLLGVLVAVSTMGVMMAGCGSKVEETGKVDAATEATTEIVTETMEEISGTEAVGTTEIEDSTSVEIVGGTYIGTYTKEAMGSEIVYEYALTLNEDNTYNYQVSFEMGGKTYPEEETGTYVAEGNVITLTPETPWKEADASIMVTSSEAGKISFSRCVSSFASEQVELEAALME